MARQSNIVDFEQAKRAARSSRPAARKAAEPVDERAQAKKQAASKKDQAKTAKAHAKKPSVKQSAVAKVPAKSKASKKRAERAYEKAVKNAPAKQDSSEPRAALYKGQMGSSHKKSMRMQEDAGQAASTKRFGRRSGGLRPWMKRTLAAVACVALAVAFVYPAARDYYVTVRDQARLQAQYEMVAARNQALER